MSTFARMNPDADENTVDTYDNNAEWEASQR